MSNSSATLIEALTIRKALDSGYSVTKNLDSSFLNTAGNTALRWTVTRTTAPMRTKATKVFPYGQSAWHAPTPLQALSRAAKALGLPDPTATTAEGYKAAKDFTDEAFREYMAEFKAQSAQRWEERQALEAAVSPVKGKVTKGPMRVITKGRAVGSTANFTANLRVPPQPKPSLYGHPATVCTREEWKSKVRLAHLGVKFLIGTLDNPIMEAFAGVHLVGAHHEEGYGYVK